MGTVISGQIYGTDAEEALQASRDEAVRLEGLLSRFIPGSDIDRIKKSAGKGLVAVDADTYDLLSRAVDFSRCCGGCFDVTVGPLVDLWASAKISLNPPAAADIEKALHLVDYTGILLDSQRNAAGLRTAGQSIDLGSIGKGYAADKILTVMKQHGVDSAYINLGGNVAVLGTKPDGSPWQIGIRHPREENSLIGAVSAVDQSVVTSGDYQRFFMGCDGKRYHHLLDVKSGYPSDSDLISVSVIAGTSVSADALSTILFTAGMKKGLDLIKSFAGVEAVFVDKDQRVFITRGLAKSFQSSHGISVQILN
jgi:thiamine biosynthesis lipoprotein